MVLISNKSQINEKTNLCEFFVTGILKLLNLQWNGTYYQPNCVKLISVCFSKPCIDREAGTRSAGLP